MLAIAGRKKPAIEFRLALHSAEIVTILSQLADQIIRTSLPSAITSLDFC